MVDRVEVRPSATSLPDGATMTADPAAVVARPRTGASAAEALAAWAADLAPTAEDLELARRALVDTVAVAVAARSHPVAPLAERLDTGGRLAVLAHLLDYDDLHLPSTSHISAVCVPATLAAGGDARAYLAGAGVMARLGSLLGWPHYAAGWHATCTAGAPAAAVAAAVATGLDADGIARAMVLALPGAGGVQSAFGTAAKSLQVGFAVDAGCRAAALAAAGATADPAALDQWLALVGGTAAAPPQTPAAVPDGLAIKVFPCCYALQRPIDAVRTALAGERTSEAEIAAIVVTVRRDALRPLIHHRPTTGLQGKFSIEYAVAAAVLDGWPGLASFTDQAVGRAEARRLVERVEVQATPGGGGLLAGRLEAEVTLVGGGRRCAGVDLPPGAPGRDLPEADFLAKVVDCAGLHATTVARLDWDQASTAQDLLTGEPTP
jgi:2-methylcitrate dehydratase PrpD